MIYSNGTSFGNEFWYPQYAAQTFQITDLTLNGQTFKADAPAAPKDPVTAVDWLRSRVKETCDAAFADIAA